MANGNETPGGIQWPDDINWPGAIVFGGEAPAFIPDDTICHLAVSAEYPSDPPIHAWTGIGELTLNGITYTGMSPDLISVRLGQATEKEDARLQVTLTGINTPDLRRAFYEFHGRVVVTVRLVYSTDGGVTWLEVPRFYRGLYSRPRLTSDTLTFEVATYRENLDRGYEQTWSDSNQQAEYTGDLFFRHLVRISEGADLTIRWPP